MSTNKDQELLETVKELRRQIETTTAVTAILGIVAIVGMSIYFHYIHSQLAEYTKPKELVNVADGLLMSELPEARKSLQALIKTNAPGTAKQLSAQAQQSIPTLRKSLEDYTKEQVSATLTEATILSADQFREFLQKNKGTIDSSLKELADSPELSEASLAKLEEQLTKHMEEDMQIQSEELFEALKTINLKLVRLRAGVDLNEEEQIERRILMIARRLQESHVNKAPEETK